MNGPLVSIIIVNWNGRKFLGDCLSSLSAISYKNVEILFVDNASSDDSIDFVKKNFPSAVVIENKKNLGLSEGHDAAFKKLKGELTLLLNPDTIVPKNLIEELIKVLDSEATIGAVQPKLIIPQTNTIDSIGAFFLPSGILYHFGREKNPDLSIYNKQMDIFSTKGACMLIKTKILRKTGIFDKDFFVYYEDTDLCMRIWLSGYRIVYTPALSVYHMGGGSSKQVAQSKILFHSYKNRLLTYLKNLSIKYLLIVIPQTLALYMFAFVFYLLKGEFRVAMIVPKSIFWNIIHFHDTWGKRKFIQNKIRVISDDMYIPKLTKKVRLSYYYYIMTANVKHYKD